MIEESAELPGWSRGRVVTRRQWAPGLLTLQLDARTDPFEAGQFFNLGLSINGELARRAYSAASAPGAPLEFFVARVDTGEFSPALFALKSGDTVWVERKPQGFFTLKYVPDAAHLWLVATGTGLGPFVSMLRSGEAWRRFQRVVLVHGVRDASQQAYQEELAELGRRYPLSLVTCFSRATPALGVKGRLTEALASGALEEVAGVGLAPETSHIMLCGNPAMIQDMMALLGTRGLVRHRVRKPGHISTEKYW